MKKIFPRLTTLPLSLISVSLLLLTAFRPSFAATRSGFPLMMELTDARSLALGGANLSETGQARSMQVNPAAAFGAEKWLQVAYAKHPVGIWSGRLAGAWPYKDFMVGGYLSTYSYGTFDETAVGHGSTGGNFTGSEQLFGVNVAGSLLPDLSWGAAGKIGWWKIYDVSASAGAIDLGLAYDTHWQGLKMGAAVRNIGSQWSASDGVKSPLPEEFAIGGSRRLAHLPLTIHASLDLRRTGEGEWDAGFLPGKPGIAFGVGGEFEILPQGSQKPLYLRIGYRSLGQGLRVGNRTDTLAGFTFGLGILVRRIVFDYTYAPMGAFGDVHRVGISGMI
jgi:hypothetical protein